MEVVDVVVEKRRKPLKPGASRVRFSGLGHGPPALAADEESQARRPIARSPSHPFIDHDRTPSSP